MTDARRYQLGIDLGTTYTAAAVARAGTAHAVQLTPDAHSMPSVVALRDDGSMLAGEAAMRRALAEPTRVGREFKRRFGDAAPMVLGGTRTSAEALTTALLREVLARVEQVEGQPPSRVTLTHPAAWGPFRLDKLRAVAAEAGIEHLDLLAEPVAAALGNADRLTDGSQVVVYDLGGGTFDAAVVSVGEHRIVGSPEGVERLGGIDIDALVMAHVDDATGGMVGDADISDPDVRSGLARLADDCRIAKEALSADSETDINVSLPEVHTSVRLTRAELEGMVRPRLDDSLAALDRTVASAGASWNDIATVLLVGGSSRIPLVAQVVREHTGRPVATATNPHLAIALGAARFAAAQEAAAVAVASSSPVTAAPAAGSASAAAASTPGRSRWPMLAGVVVAVAALIVGGIVLLGGDDEPATTPVLTGVTTSAATQATDGPATTASATTGSPTTTTETVEPREITLPVGDASLTATECIDTTGLVARSTAIDIDGATLAAIIDGNLYLLSVDATDCTISAPTDELSGMVRDGDTDFVGVAIVGDLLVVGSEGTGAIVDRTSGASVECDLLRALVNPTAEGNVSTYDIGANGLDVVAVAADGCTMVQANGYPNYRLFATAAGPTTQFVGIADGNNIAVVALRGNTIAWTYGGGKLQSIDGLATCGGFVCVLDATSEQLTVLSAARGQVVGSVDVADLGGAVAQRLSAAGDGWLTLGEPGSNTVLLRLAVS